MPILKLDLDYSPRDFDSIRFRLQDLIRYVYPDWTDFNIANLGNILLELFAYVGDVLHFYQDNQAAEAFWPTLTQRISAIKLGRLIGFTLTGASRATGTVRFSLASVATDKVIIPLGTRLATSDPETPIYFRTTAYAELLVGTTFIDVPVEQAEAITGSSFASNDEPNQEFVLTRTPYLDNSATVTAANGAYTEVDSFLGSGPTSRVYVVLVDQLDQAHIRFGNGVTGNIPSGQIDVDHKIGGGSDGNVEVGKINVMLETVAYQGGGTAPVTVTNQTATSGGEPRMTLDEARAQAPASLKVLTRTVTREDFETVATGIPGVARALMVTANEYAGLAENYGELYVVAQGVKLASGRIEPAAPSSTMLADIRTEIDTNKPPTITFTYQEKAAVFKDIAVSMRVYLKQGADGAIVGAAIREALKDFFAAQLSNGLANSAIDFGANLKDSTGTIVGEIAWSDVFNAARDVENVRKIDEGVSGVLLNGRRESVTLLPIEFPRLSTVTIIDVDTGASL